VHIPLPDINDRKETIELYLSKKNHEVDVEKVAQMTIGFNAAALDTLTNEAALFSIKNKRDRVQTEDFEAVKDKVLQGKQKILSFSKKEREIQAVYQASKTVVATWLDVEFDKIGLVNRDFITSEHEILSKSRLLSQVKVYLAGSIATKIRYEEKYTNASDDIFKARELVKKIIYQYSMGEELIPNVNEEITLLDESIKETTTLLNTLETAMNETARHLLTHEHINVDECRDILRKIF
jgi:ATP-dependent Zn protease